MSSWFVECKACRGSLELCESCTTNREMIELLEEEVIELRRKVIERRKLGRVEPRGERPAVVGVVPKTLARFAEAAARWCDSGRGSEEESVAFNDLVEARGTLPKDLSGWLNGDSVESRYGSLLRKAREASGKSMGELARHLEVGVDFVSDVERGLVLPILPSATLRAGEFLGLPGKDLDELVAESELVWAGIMQKTYKEE